MICSDKEWKSCREERLGCEGCYYKDTEEEMKDILQSFVDLAEESLMAKELLDDDIKATKWALNKIVRLEQRVKELEGINEEHRKINGELREEKLCLHCGSNEANYCEECYQDLIGQNAKLQIEQHIPRID